MDTVLVYVKQPSTWRGLSILLGVFGVYVDPELVVQIGTTVGAVIGAIEVARNEKPKS